MTQPIRWGLPARRTAAPAALCAGLAGVALLLVLLARPAAGASPSPAASGGDAPTATPVALGSGALDQIAGTLAEGSPVLPDERDSGLGGLAATTVLLASALVAAVLTGSALGGATAGPVATRVAKGGGAGGEGEGEGRGAAAGDTGEAAAGTAPATTGDGEAGAGEAGAPEPAGAGAPPQMLGGLTTTAGSGLPLPRAELVAASLSIARSMRRLTDGPDPASYKTGDVVQLLGDAASIGALATILAPATGLVSLAGAGAATAAEASPGEVLERLRRGFGQLGYMQGVLDENISARDGQLAGLDGAPQKGLGRPPSRVPDDLSKTSDKDLRALRAAWAARADVLFDALIAAQQDMGDLDDRRRNLAHQLDAVNDLLATLGDAGTTPVPPHVGDTLCYGFGWYQAGEAARMAAALRESRAMARASSMAATLRQSGAMARASAMVAAGAVQALGPPAASGKKAKPGRRGKGAGSTPEPIVAPESAERPRSLPFAEWAAANRFTGGRMGVLQALAGLERWNGFYDALTGTLQRQLSTLRAQADTAGATRRMLSAEMQHRTLEAGR